MQIESHVVLSTGHLSIQTRNWLEALDWKKEGPAGGPTGYGWFLYAADDNDCSCGGPAHAPDGEFPADLWAVFEAARAKRVSYVHFDSDADFSDDLPIYDDLPALVDANGHLVPGQVYDIEQFKDDGLWYAEIPMLAADDAAEGFDTAEECISNLQHRGARHRRVVPLASEKAA